MQQLKYGSTLDEQLIESRAQTLEAKQDLIVGGILFALFAAFRYWYPKITGRMLSERLGKLHFSLFLIRFHTTFDVMHFAGILGMPRRIYTYEPRHGWETLNWIATIGAFTRASPYSYLSRTLFIPISKDQRPATIPGMPGPWNGR